ncbi:hypothetical protein [Virgisporangium aurantiacum]|uniref:Uncharacterized protein n=1 Tax=Virgisporangium aurantiacum TaxID=175570 RepID=A0A8J3Z4N2_9ACTN|nr:hypothetical protein [Virgisporangium aurantiacum]GIJ56332.1 hypothetical protein Vau01_038480 [Virgisporangium aurantiacum]
MDYSLLSHGLLVEEFVYGDDHTTVGLRVLTWTRADPRWLSTPSFGRAVRTDPDLLAGVTPTDRAGAERAYRALAGGELPDEAALRARFVGHEPFATAPPLRLGPTDPPAGFREKRVYRVLFAKEPAGAAPGAGSRTVGGDHFSWDVRRVGRGVAWALDVTVLLAGDTGDAGDADDADDADDTVGPVLRDLTAAVRRHGLVPVTTERFA